MEDQLTAILGAIVTELTDPSNMSLPDPHLLADYQLMADRRIWITDEVDMNTLAIEKRILLWNIQDRDTPPAERKPIYIYIFCYGGDADMMFSLIDIISASKTPVYTYNMGTCASAAALIFLAGHKRLMMPRATVLIHQGKGSLQGDAGKLLDASDSYRKLLKHMNEYILDKTTIPKQTLSKKRNDDWELNAQECLDYQICHKIIDSVDDVV